MDICQCSIYSILFINLILIVLIHTLNKKYNYHTSDTISAKLIPNQATGADIPAFVSTHCNNINNTAATQRPSEPTYNLLLMNKNGKIVRNLFSEILHHSNCDVLFKDKHIDTETIDEWINWKST